MDWYQYVIIILLLLFFIGITKIRLLFIFKNGFVGCIYLKILFFKFKVFSNIDKDKNKREIVKAKKKSSKIEKKKEKKKKSKLKQSFADKIYILKIIWKPTFSLLCFLNRGFKIDRVNVSIKIVGEDAHKVAVSYGNFCYIFYSLLKILSSICNVEVNSLNIYPSFIDENLTSDIYFRMSISFGRLFIGLVRYFFVILTKIILEKKKMKRSDED